MELAVEEGLTGTHSCQLLMCKPNNFIVFSFRRLGLHERSLCEEGFRFRFFVKPFRSSQRLQPRKQSEG